MNKDTGVKGTEEGVQRALMNKDSIIEKGLQTRKNNAKTEPEHKTRPWTSYS
jgi:hypothetical protein